MNPEGRDAIIKEPFMHDKGWFHMPQASGLGFEIDHRQLEKYGKCFFKAS
ncbi:hypothetical protein [Breoghania sp.]|nr:hypothetical protein [Breoghania sp.]MDJ0933408.1 hypothetical protein [Breoghania sp.]